MSRSVKTEAVVLRSIRYGEADRILHLYSESYGKISAIAKGARKARSRFGGRLEPFFRLDLVLYRGRGGLSTVTGATTVASYPKLRESIAALNAASGGAMAVLRLMTESEQNGPAYNLVCRYFGLLDKLANSGKGVEWQALELAFRMKLLVAAGIAPELYRCASCGSDGQWMLFSPSAGGVVCPDCGDPSFSLDSGTLDFMQKTRELPMAEVTAKSEKAVRLTDQVIRETVEHHGHVSLARVA